MLPLPRLGFNPPWRSLLSLFSFTRSDLLNAVEVDDGESVSGAGVEEEVVSEDDEEGVGGTDGVAGVSTTDDVFGVAVVVASASDDLGSLGALDRFRLGNASSKAWWKMLRFGLGGCGCCFG